MLSDEHFRGARTFPFPLDSLSYQKSLSTPQHLPEPKGYSRFRVETKEQIPDNIQGTETGIKQTSEESGI